LHAQRRLGEAHSLRVCAPLPITAEACNPFWEKWSVASEESKEIRRWNYFSFADLCVLGGSIKCNWKPQGRKGRGIDLLRL
jgi:hypothetical protein